MCLIIYLLVKCFELISYGNVSMLTEVANSNIYHQTFEVVKSIVVIEERQNLCAYDSFGRQNIKC